jgi:hypothetical protein
MKAGCEGVGLHECEQAAGCEMSSQQGVFSTEAEHDTFLGSGLHPNQAAWGKANRIRL